LECCADIEIQANEILHHKLTLNGYLAEFTGQSMERITQVLVYIAANSTNSDDTGLSHSPNSPLACSPAPFPCQECIRHGYRCSAHAGKHLKDA
jgi:hypothetical protein